MFYPPLLKTSDVESVSASKIVQKNAEITSFSGFFIKSKNSLVETN